MISDKNRGETRPNIQKESIPSASEKRDEAGHVGVKTPLLGSSASTPSYFEVLLHHEAAARMFMQGSNLRRVTYQ